MHKDRKAVHTHAPTRPVPFQTKGASHENVRSARHGAPLRSRGVCEYVCVCVCVCVCVFSTGGAGRNAFQLRLLSESSAQGCLKRNIENSTFRTGYFDSIERYFGRDVSTFRTSGRTSGPPPPCLPSRFRPLLASAQRGLPNTCYHNKTCIFVIGRACNVCAGFCIAE